MWYSGSLQKFITALWAIRCAELFVESHRQHNGKYIFVPLPFYGDFAGMVRDNRVRNGQTEPKMTVIRACFVCAEKRSNRRSRISSGIGLPVFSTDK